MYIYLIVFFISCVSAYISQKCFEQEKKVSGIFFAVLTIAIPSLLAGLRDTSIGTDVEIYMERYFQYASMSGTFSEYRQICDTDLLYAILNYVISRFTSNFNIFMFIVQFIITSLVYVISYKNRDKSPIWLSLFVYFMVYYNRNLNIIRQSIATAITFYGYKYIKNKEIGKYILCILIATLFHSTAIFAITIYVIHNMIEGKKGNKYKFIILVAIIILIANYGKILTILIYNIGIIPIRYARYIPEGEFSFSITETLIKLVILVFIYFHSKALKQYNSENNFMVYMALLDFVFLQIGAFAGYAQRIAFYFGYYYILLIPQIYRIYKKRDTRILVLFGIIFILLFYWYNMFIVLNYGETYPYKIGI